jgi:hypothetical protein
LKQEGVIEERQHLALETIQKFYEEHGFWPTQREAHVFLVEDLDVLDKPERTEAITDGYRFLGRRMGELTEGSDSEHPDLLEKKEKREHDYLQEEHPGADSGREGEPHRIIADVAEKEKQTVETGSDSVQQGNREESGEAEVRYIVDDDGGQVRSGSPEEAIQETDDLDALKQELEKENLLDKYRELLSQHGDFVFDPDEEDGEDDSEEQEIYMKDGEVLV